MAPLDIAQNLRRLRASIRWKKRHYPGRPTDRNGRHLAARREPTREQQLVCAAAATAACTCGSTRDGFQCPAIRLGKVANPADSRATGRPRDAERPLSRSRRPEANRTCSSSGLGVGQADGGSTCTVTFLLPPDTHPPIAKARWERVTETSGYRHRPDFGEKKRPGRMIR